MICKRCGGKGYLEEWLHRDAQMNSILKQCCDVRKYSEAVTFRAKHPERFYKPAPQPIVLETKPTNVIPFKQRQDNDF